MTQMHQFVNGNGLTSPLSTEYPSLRIAEDGRRILSTYCAKGLYSARAEENYSEYQFFQALAELLSEERIGLILGRLFYELPTFIEKWQTISAQDTETHKAVQPVSNSPFSNIG